MAKKKGGKGGLGVYSLKDKSTKSDNLGTKNGTDYPSVNSFGQRSATAPTPDTLGPRKA